MTTPTREQVMQAFNKYCKRNGIAANGQFAIEDGLPLFEAGYNALRAKYLKQQVEQRVAPDNLGKELTQQECYQAGYEQGKRNAVPEDIRKDAESWRAYKKRKDEVIAAGMGKKILRDAAAPKQEK